MGMYAVMVAAGLGIPVMAAMNVGLGARIGVPASVTALFLVGAMVSGAITLATGSPTLRAVSTAPGWLYLGGLVVVFYIMSITVLGPKIGIGTAVLCVLLGQILSAALVDHFGWFGAPVSPISLKKIVGLVLMVAGIWLARRTV
ncbi:MAG: hypothetical protein CMK07_10925 [Ponticaulis sp.]|nr:hypothetical protein [Ponticaulis sp.]